MVEAVEVLDLATCEFRAMGTDVHVLVLDGVDDDLHWARAEVERLEDLWSRFREDSEVSRINGAAGQAVVVSQETIDLVQAAERAWLMTGGAFDPLLGAELAALGYDRTFDEVNPANAGTGSYAAMAPVPRAVGDIRVDAHARTIRIPRGAALDLGGIAKGWAADQLVKSLLARGAKGACVNLGGDLAVGGRAPHPRGWPIDVKHAASPPPRLILLTAGGAATSTTLRRAWLGPDGDPRHHLLDPATGTSCEGALVEITVVARSAAEAEVLTKLAFAAPDRLQRAIDDAGAAAIMTSEDGVTVDLGDLGRLGMPTCEDQPDAG
jgi:thiamine biosynthesis lipoprotein